MEKIINFFKRHSFYVILTICLGILGTVAFVTGGNKADEKKPVANVENQEKDTSTVIEDAELVKEEEAKLQAEKELKLQEQAKEEAKKLEEESVTTNAKPKSEIINPVKNGLVTRKFSSIGEIAKDGKSSNTYPGIDIEVAKDTEVFCAMDGEVIEAQSGDSRYGNYVSVRSSNGKIITYANLDIKLNVKKGDKVVQGSVVGKVGSSVKSGPATRTSSEYLLLEVKEDIVPVDPMTIFKELKVK
ncbi:MAG: peptidoglycan DD-metalloendopeptidase family protein [Sarcina sp.]